MNAHVVPAAVQWRNGMVLAPEHFLQSDARAASLAHMAALAAEPWPWGFARVVVDQTALAAAQLRIDCEGIFPGGVPFSRCELTQMLTAGEDGDRRTFQVTMSEDGPVTLSEGEGAPADTVLPVARIVFRSGVWSEVADWSPPAHLLGPDHPLRLDMAKQLGALAALATGFAATVKLPRAENRPAARMLAQVAAAMAEGAGVMDALLAAPVVSPGRLGIEALRLALRVRTAAGIFERLDATWDPADQRGSMRRLLHAAESAASGIGLPFRASIFHATEAGETLLVENVPRGALLLAIEASRPGDLITACAWFDGAALAAPERIGEAFSHRVAGCPRHPLERDPRTGVSSGPLLALYQVENSDAWRDDSCALALGAKAPPPPDTSFSIFVPEDLGEESEPSPTGPADHVGRTVSPPWYDTTVTGGRVTPGGRRQP